MITKLDILLDYNELISTVNSVVTTRTISDLLGDENLYYQSFIDLVNGKTPEKYNQVFITETDVKRYVLLLVESLEVKSMQEVLYEDLTTEEKLIFDNFYNTFTSWR